MTAKRVPDRAAASKNITKRIKELGDWRGETLAWVRQMIHDADPQIQEEWKWEVPAWYHDGGVCTGETYKQVVKLTFFRGASLPDPQRLFNSSLEGSTRRAIDIRQGEKPNEAAFKELIRSAVAANSAAGAPRASPKKPGTVRPTAKGTSRASTPRTSATRSKSPPKPDTAAKGGASGAKPPKLLSGGNPQIAKADGDAPVQAYITAMPGWKRDIGRQLDALIARTVPNVHKAVKWNSPLYGIEGQGWFLGVHTHAHYVKVAFFRGTSLRPLPPGPSKSKDARYIDIREEDTLDEAQMARWVKQASKLPGWVP